MGEGQPWNMLSLSQEMMSSKEAEDIREQKQSSREHTGRETKDVWESK